jgi:hypothetical protein
VRKVETMRADVSRGLLIVMIIASALLAISLALAAPGAHDGGRSNIVGGKS